MTAYNREKYIAEAIESVLAQTCTDFELIIVDDCSKDRTVEIAQRYTKDPRVRVHVNERNLGQFPNRNRSAELACGQFVKYVDSDDLMYPHGLEVMVRCIESFPMAGYGLSYDEYYIDGKPYPLQLTPREAYQWHFLRNGLFGSAPLSAIIRTSAFRSVGGYTGKPHACGDTEFWLIIGARYPVVIMPVGLTWWRDHDEQEDKYEKRTLDYLNERLHIHSSALESPACPLDEVERNESLRMIKHAHARAIVGRAARMKISDALHIFKGSGLTASQLFLALKRP
jgi:glycosyltransferase involved in cell wall biosynthesis